MQCNLDGPAKSALTHAHSSSTCSNPAMVLELHACISHRAFVFVIFNECWYQAADHWAHGFPIVWVWVRHQGVPPRPATPLSISFFSELQMELSVHACKFMNTTRKKKRRRKEEEGRNALAATNGDGAAAEEREEGDLVFNLFLINASPSVSFCRS